MYHLPDSRSLGFFSPPRLSLSLCSLLLVLLLAACGLGGGRTGTVPTTTSGTPPAQPTSASATSLKTYTGNGFRIGYPAGWTVKTVGKAGMAIFFDQQADAAQGSSFAIGINPAGGAVPPATVLQFALRVFMAEPHYHQVAIAPRATVGGDSWEQIAATGDVQIPGQAQPVTYGAVAMADNHPTTSPTARGFSIRYTAEASRFPQIRMSIFQPMLQSFQFL